MFFSCFPLTRDQRKIYFFIFLIVIFPGFFVGPPGPANRFPVGGGGDGLDLYVKADFKLWALAILFLRT